MSKFTVQLIGAAQWDLEYEVEYRRNNHVVRT